MIQKLQKAWMTMAVTAMVLCGFAVSAQAQDLNTVWERTARTGAEEPIPAWFEPGFVRGMAYGVVDGNERVYAADRTNTRIRVMDATTGADVELDVDFDMTNVEGGLFLLNDVAVSSDGKIFMGNLTTDASAAANPFKVYMWNGEGGDFTSSHSIPSAGVERMGDKFTVIGSVEDNTAEIWVPVQGSNPGKIYVLTTEDQGATWTENVITLTGTNVLIPSNASVAPFGVGGDADFYIAGNGSSPKRYAGDGSFVTGSVVAGTTGRNGLQHFSLDENDYLAVYTYNPDDGSHARRTGFVIVYNVTDAENVEKIAESPLMGNDVDTFSSTHGEAHVRINEDNTYNIYALDGVNGFAAFTNAKEPELFTEYFEYDVDELLVNHGWTAHSGAGTNSIYVADTTLVYDGYAGSGEGRVARMRHTGEDVHRVVGSYTEGSVYAAAMVHVLSASQGGDYFLHFGPNPISTTFRGRVFIKTDEENNLAFGISKSGGAADAIYTDFSYNLNETYLLVLEYVFLEDASDIVSIYVNPAGSELPATPDATDDESTGSDLPDLSTIALRQGAGGTNDHLVIGGLRIFNDYAEVVGSPAGPLAGTYYIPQGDNPQGFETLADGIAALNEYGLSDHTTFLLDADLDEGDVVLRINRGDLSEDTRLTIKPAPGKQVKVSTIDFRLVDTGYITIDGSANGDGSRDLTFEKNAMGGAGFIGLLSNTISVELSNINVTYAEDFGAATYGILINRRESGDDSGRADDVLVENISVGTVENPFNDAIWFLGSPSLEQFFHRNVTFTGNEFHAYRSAIRTQTHINTVFTDNEIYVYGSDADVVEAVRLNTPVESFTFTNNEIAFVSSSRTNATTFVGFEATNSLVSTAGIYNNTISNAGFESVGTDHSFYGFRHNGAASTAEFQLFHNSIRLGDTDQTGVQAAIGKTAAASGSASVNVQNNIIVNERDAENSYAYQWTGGGFSSNYNNIVTTGEGGVALFGETRYADLAEFSGTTSNDVNSTTAEVEFVSETNLRLTGASIGDNRLGGTPLAAVSADIDGTERSATVPYKGAFEGDVALTPALEAIGPFALLSPSDGFSLTLVGDADTEVEIQWEMPESSEAWARMGGTLEDDAFAHGGDGANAQGKYLGMVLGQEAWLRSPKVVNPGTLSFWGATFSPATVLTLSVEISEDGEEWEELTSYAAAAGDGGDITSSWQNKEIEVNREGAFYFRWRQHGESVEGAAFIDDVELSVMGSAAVLEEGFEDWDAFKELLFTWHVDLPTGDFSDPLLSIPSDDGGSSNQLTLTYGAVDAAIAALGVEEGASVNLQWTVTAELMENVRFAESPFAITITRSLGVSTEREEMPLVFSLSQNYPNPFNPTTSIKFTLPETIDVRLEVYNIAGQRVSTLVNSQMSAGEHVVSFDARALASGVYIYRIIAGDYVKSNKMTLIK